tara:strand:- start:7 stop:537 length:531 start_codon:yes stop_codon:yes gene_type:complete
MSNENIKIEDNFLAQGDFDNLHNIMMTPEFPWFLSGIIDSRADVDKFQFIHFFYKDCVPTSNWFPIMTPILETLNPLSIWRIKANLLTRTSNIIENTFHADIGDLSEKKLKQWTTAILYINTNNGYTKFKDGMKVESVANRMVTFPTNTEHTGTSCTDEKARVIINFNYFTNDTLL